MIKTRSESAEVVYADEEVIVLKAQELELLKQLALKNPRKRIRLCTHETPADILHEMFIVHTKGSYIRPHKSIGKPESFYIIEGQVDIVFFHNDGRLYKVISMGELKSGLPFYYRLSDQLFHTLIIRSEFLVCYEITTGPFLRSQTLFADWSVPDLNLSTLIEKDTYTIVENMFQKDHAMVRTMNIT